MIATYECNECGIRLNTDRIETEPCKCGGILELKFKKEWVGSMDSGHEEVFNASSDVKTNAKIPTKTIKA